MRTALAFPDIYDIGMSHLGLRILYKVVNDLPFASAERVFSPWTDLEAHMRAHHVPLSSLESNTPLRDFDIVGFSLQYELSYTTVLNMLDLGGIPVKSEDRSGPVSYPLVIAGGPCTVNPAPMSPFIDAFLIGDGEEAIVEILSVFNQWKTEGDRQRDSLLKALSEIEGVYVPIHSGSDMKKVRRRFIRSLDDVPYPDKPVLPFTQIVHDRVNVEVSRGCSMGCRFCQAGIIYRPVRERSPERVLELAENALRNTGYEEVSFTSLSAGDYRCLLYVLKEFNRRFGDEKIALSLPSLRVGAVNREVLAEIRSVKKTGFTIAPEAATDRLRRVINKDFSGEEYEQALKTLFEEGWLNLKLYFMVGLPTETDEDVDAIAGMALKALKTAKKYANRFVNVTVGVSPFVPKAHTSFQWFGQNTMDELKEKKTRIREGLRKKGLNVKGHDVEMSLLEAAFARGSSELSRLVETAWSNGCRLDGWTENFDYGRWTRAMEQTGVDAAAIACKSFSVTDALPWDGIDIGVSKEFLWREYGKALSEEISVDCRRVCHSCGLACEKKTEGLRSESAGQKEKYSPLIFDTGPRFKPVKIRVEFSKTSRMRYLSHFELVSAVHRAIRRAGFPVEYSKGFHPAPNISFGPPLGVGIAGIREYFDMEVTPPFDLHRNTRLLNAILPEGLRVRDMMAVPIKGQSLNSFVRRYEYVVRGGDIDSFERFLQEKEILVQREKGVVDIRKMVEEASVSNNEEATLLLADSGELKVRLGEIMQALFGVPLESLDVTRAGLFGWEGGWARPIERKTEWTAKFSSI